MVQSIAPVFIKIILSLGPFMQWFMEIFLNFNNNFSCLINGYYAFSIALIKIFKFALIYEMHIDNNFHIGTL